MEIQNKQRAIYLFVLLIICGIANASLECNAEAAAPRRYKRGLFAALGRGHNPILAETFPVNHGKESPAHQQRIFDLPFFSTRENPSYFCNQDHYISLGSVCKDEIFLPEQIQSYKITSPDQLLSFFNQINFNKIYHAHQRVFDHGEQFQQISERLTATLANNNYLVAEYIDIVTHTTEIERPCMTALNDDFVSDTLNLPATNSTPEEKQQYDAYISKYGYSVITKLIIGGRALRIREFRGDQTYTPVEVVDLLNDNSIILFGGDQVAIRSSNNKVAKWLETLKKDPAVLQTHVIFIDELLDNYAFSGDSNSSNKKANIKKLTYAVLENPNNDFEIMFTDGSTETYSCGDHVVAPAGLFVSNIKYLNRNKFRSMSEISWGKASGLEREQSNYDDYELIDNIIGEWFLDPTDLSPIISMDAEILMYFTEDLIMFYEDNEPDTIPYDYDNDEGMEYYFYSEDGLTGFVYEWVNNTPSESLATYDIQVKWTDLRVTFHRVNDPIMRTDETEAQISDLFILTNKQQINQLNIGNCSNENCWNYDGWDTDEEVQYNGYPQEFGWFKKQQVYTPITKINILYYSSQYFYLQYIDSSGVIQDQSSLGNNAFILSSEGFKEIIIFTD